MDHETLLCSNCWCPSERLVQVRGYEVCRDCADLAASPLWARIAALKDPHPFVYGPGANGSTHCNICGADKNNPVHPAAKIIPTINLLGSN